MNVLPGACIQGLRSVHCVSERDLPKDKQGLSALDSAKWPELRSQFCKTVKCRLNFKHMNSLSHSVEALSRTHLKQDPTEKQKSKKSQPIPTISGKQRRRTNKHLSFLKAAFAAGTALEKDLVWV